jgi:hypothetical protein
MDERTQRRWIIKVLTAEAMLCMKD